MSLDLTLKQPVYEGNLTHNLGKMASACGLYNAMWRPYKLFGYEDDQEEHVYISADMIIESLEAGIKELKENPKKYKKLNPENGWGDYDGLLRVAEKYLNHCKVYPEAEVHTCR